MAADEGARDRFIDEAIDDLLLSLTESEQDDLIEQVLQLACGDDNAAKEALRQAAREEASHEANRPIYSPTPSASA